MDAVFVKNKRKNSLHLKKPIKSTYIRLTLLTLWILVPFYILIISTFKTNQELSYTSFSWWPKMGFSVEGFVKFFQSDALLGISMIRALGNTLWINLPPLIIGLFVSALSAYGFSKLKFKGKDFMFGFLMLTMMLPGCITLTTSFLLYDIFGWVDTPLPLMIPGFFGGIGTIFFLRQYISGIPNDLVEAAGLDGMGEFSIFIKIIMPMCWPALLAQFILGFIGRYNDYLGPLIYLQSAELYTLQIALKVYSGVNSQNLQVTLAGCAISMLPLLIIYLVFQKFILNGISMTSGLKI